MSEQIRVALLDQYQSKHLHEEYADFSKIPDHVKVEAFQEHFVDEDVLARQLQDFRIIVIMRERTPFQKSLLEKLPNLKLLITTGPMNAAVDGSACKELGIKYGGTPFSPPLLLSTREISWALILACAKHLETELHNVRSGGWQTTVGFDLLGKTLGLYGLGNIAKAMVPIAKAFGMKVVAYSQNLTKDAADEAGVAKADSLVALAEQSDFLSIHQKLSDRSKGKIDATVLKALGPESFLINTSRGPIVDEEALIEALKSGTIAGAGLDVFDLEPLAKDNPLRTLKNVFVTPHIGYGTKANYSSFYPAIVDSVSAFVTEGKVLNEIA